jgi:hypothetical protein
MQTSTIVAAVLAPTLGGGIWWLLQRPGKWVSDRLWKRLPEGRLRRVLLKRVS